MDNKMKMGLVVLIRNERNLIDSFIKQNSIFSLFSDICFIDDFSNDGSYEFLNMLQRIRVQRKHLDLDFASQRNYANSLLQTDYICKLDMDEFMSPQLKNWIKHFNGNLDYYSVDRCEIIENKFREFTKQPFLFKNKKSIFWERPIHEYIIGYITHQHLSKPLCVVHNKSKERAIMQHEFYWNNWQEHRDICKIVDEQKEKKK